MVGIKRYRYIEKTRLQWRSNSGILCEKQFERELEAEAYGKDLVRRGISGFQLLAPDPVEGLLQPAPPPVAGLAPPSAPRRRRGDAGRKPAKSSVPPGSP